MKSCLVQKAFLSGFQGHHIVVLQVESAGTRATLCSSKVCRLVELRLQTSMSFSPLEVACFHAQFDWNRHDDMMLCFSVV